MTCIRLRRFGQTLIMYRVYINLQGEDGDHVEVILEYVRDGEQEETQDVIADLVAVADGASYFAY